tara:strand:- start:54 stop:1103 length:1050 start_codon:yes stop_codon:yes gene_type:complete
MALQGSGNPIDISDINVELGNSATAANSSLTTLSGEADAIAIGEGFGSTPHAMSEFYEFDASCFIAGTKVLMDDGRLLDIEDIKVGDFVQGHLQINKVIKLDKVLLGNRELYSFNGDKPFVTAEHPFMSPSGWKSINPEMTFAENISEFKDENDISNLVINDLIITSNGEKQISKLSSISDEYKLRLYNLRLNGDHTYFANDYLVHNKCFVAGTLITMADETYKPIEEIQVGDEVFTQLGNQKVLEIVSPIHDDIIEYIFSGGITTKNTADHPYYVVNKGWSSYEPLLSEQRYNVKSEQIEIGDEFIDDSDKKVKLEDVNEIPGKFQTYTFSTDSKTYYANTILVHSEI